MTSAFVRRTGMLAAGQAAVKSTQLVLAVVLVRILSPTEWNETSFLLSIYLAATVIGSLHLHHGLLYVVPRVDVELRRSLVLRNIALLLVVGVAIAVLLTAAAPLVSGGRLGDAAHLPWLGLAIALELPAASVAMTLVADQRFGSAALWDVAGTALVIVSTVVGATMWSGAGGVLGGLIASGTARLVGGLWCVWSVLPRGGRAPTAVLARQLLYSIPLGLTATVSILNRLVDKWFIAVFDAGNFGVYAIAAQEVPLLAVLPYAGGTALVTALIGAFQHGEIGVARAHWLHLTMTMSAIVVPLGTAIILIAPELLTVVFTSEFSTGVVPFQLFTFVTLHRVAEYGMLLRAAGRTRDLLVVASITLGSNVLLAGFGAWLGGMTGASIGTVIASGIGWWVALRFIAAALEVPVRDAFAWRAWLSCVAIATLAAVVAQVTADLWTDGVAARLIIKLAIFVAVFTSGLRWWRTQPGSAPPTAVTAPELPDRRARPGVPT
ncbi:MAG: lipopolysaccharide biosynthesis protein [Ilumatobacteraceae bacterium]|nr:lipopolysaccharide biosynthesis protein [Ilumatobacteraceae bacterium]